MLSGKLFKYWTYQLFAPGTVLKEKYAAFKSLLAHDKKAHDLMAGLEEIYYGHVKKDFSAVERLCDALSREVAGIVREMSHISPAAYPDLLAFFKKIEAYVRFMSDRGSPDPGTPFTLGLSATGPGDLELTGGKALNLSLVKNGLRLPVPDGFTITTNAYHRFIACNALREPIDDRLAALDIDDTAMLEATSGDIVRMIMEADIPPEVQKAVLDSWHTLADSDTGGCGVAMRSSAVGEDSTASFAGQYKTLLNVARANLFDAYKRIIAGKYAPEALHYRISYGFSDLETAMAVLVLPMVDAAASGIMYTTDIDNPAARNLRIHAIWGLGERLVGGESPADIFTLSKQNPPRMVASLTAEKKRQTVCAAKGRLQSLTLDDVKQNAPSLDAAAAVRLAGWGMALENHFQKPQDIEWALDARGDLWILQTRPLGRGTGPENVPTCDFSAFEDTLLLRGGERAASGIGGGTVFNLAVDGDLAKVPDQAVLVAQNASPAYVKVISRLSAIVTDTGSAAGHLASVAREFGTPALVNTGSAGRRLEHGHPVTVHADALSVYAGIHDRMLESACARSDLMADSPFLRKMRYLLKFVSTLELVDPEAVTFAPQYCRSYHDIIRYSHETAVREMFQISENRIRKIGFARKLDTRIPMQFLVLDVGGGLEDGESGKKTVTIENVRNKAMRAVFEGMTHPDIPWEHRHFDWEAHDRIVMSGGIASPDATMFASHAVVSESYMNLNLRFGYHFVIVDALSGREAEDNLVQFRFSGGGTDMSQRMLRADFLKKVLQRIGFEVSVKSDLVDARLQGAAPDDCLTALDMVGRLLGASPLLDMVIKDRSMVDGFVDAFMHGRYHFGSSDLK
ncbi:MAG: hypothetical protein LJE94_05135 [Deltaproteobacteria bacterium]|nr:hypothetical protein [Deltaproteobacteria bacterium]